MKDHLFFPYMNKMEFMKAMEKKGWHFTEEQWKEAKDELFDLSIKIGD